ncbi:MAG: hypothetical protein ACOWWR_08300 [Eubacteriales bacterium]
MITKFGEKGVLNLRKAVPVIGGVISGGIDFFSTKVIGNVSTKIFLADNEIHIHEERNSGDGEFCFIS